MKYGLYLLLSVPFMLSCDNELDIIEDRKDIPVVYGFLSLSDTAQYIRLEKAFVDENTSALEIAQIADSLYYPDATVEIVRNSNGARFLLERVDGNLEGYVREDGAFAQSPNYLYKIKSENINLVGGEAYTLTINKGDNSDAIESSTVLLGETRIRRPDPVTSNILDFDYVDRTRFFWQTTGSARIHNLFIEFNFREKGPETGGVFERKTVEWPIIRNYESDDDRVEVEIEGLQFYNFLAGAIEKDEDIERRFEDMTVRVISGGEEIRDFVAIGSANLGITSTQDVPVYSNIPGGRGIFSSTFTASVDRISLSNPSLDSLRNGIITRDLNFTN